ncbi:MAG: oxidoreductase [Candidatus Puniceispirillum sp. TMED52]|nr:oxidoreductase [SAR116 cluster bacterium]OUU45535.1 MAG: oxidoreductase [Candidatus Puniceispirillum sp. TMED52]
MTFKALLLTCEDDAKPVASLAELTDADLPDGDVIVDVAYSGLNYKDGMCLNGLGRLVRAYPHVAGVDMAGVVRASKDDRYKAGDEVILTGWRVGEVWWGGFAQRASVKADWLLLMPEGFTAKTAMGVGTAGMSAMLAIMALEDAGITPDAGPVLVTGATGGVGSIAVQLLARRGYQVAAVSGKPDADAFLKPLGASEVLPRDEFEPNNRPLESSRWAAAIDNVGGDMLSRILAQVKYGGAVAIVGNAGSNDIKTTNVPFMLRGISMLGIDSVMQPNERRQAVWAELAKTLDADQFASVISSIALADLPEYGNKILNGNISGRTVVDLSL